MSIKGVKAREILDSRGYPTIEVEILTAKGIFRADVPSGTSTGKFEAHELRDNQKKRYDGKGFKKAITAINNISKKLIGMDPKNQKEIDMRLINLDGTIDKSSIGANALLGISIAVCKAGAAESNMPLFEYIKKNNLSQPSPVQERAKGEVEIISDSKYVILGITEWIFGWQKNNWRNAAKKPVLNKELWEELYTLTQELKPKWTYVKGHNENKMNNRADLIATSFAEGEPVKLKRNAG